MSPGSPDSQSPSGRDRVLSGYNHNFHYRGRVYHVQTEDYGHTNSYICTHLFIDGAVVASSKHGYPKELESATAKESIRTLMMESHRAMFLRLKAGEFNEQQVCNPLVAPPLGTKSGKRGQVAPPATAKPKSPSSGSPEQDSTDKPHEPVDDPCTETGIPIGVDPKLEASAPILHAQIDTTEPGHNETLTFRRSEPDAELSKIMNNLCERVQGLAGMVMLDHNRLVIYEHRNVTLELATGFETITSLCVAQAKLAKDLSEDHTDFSLVACAGRFLLMLDLLYDSTILFLAIDRSRGNLALARHQVDAMQPLIVQHLKGLA